MGTEVIQEETLEFFIHVLGRTLEHLGVQTYKRRDLAILELVANSWDAIATEVRITLPEEAEYEPHSSVIRIEDNGRGMDDDIIQNEYLVVGRNRRQGGEIEVEGRRLLGRKGIGKLAGFGIAKTINILTWREGKEIEFHWDADSVKKEDSVAEEVPILGISREAQNEEEPTGTIVTLSNLKHKTCINIENLHETLARRLSRTIKGNMKIYINDEELKEPVLELDHRVPNEGYEEETLGSGAVIYFRFAFSKKVIPSKEMRGFAIYANGKTMQAPPFFFDVEGTASGQHGTRYVTGEIEAGFLDESVEDENDVISTDRQEIDWDAEGVQEFREWGEKLSRNVLREWVSRRGEKMENWILEDEGFKIRIEALDSTSKKQVSKFFKTLGQVEGETATARNLADSLIRAYEFQHFHNVIEKIEAIGEDPDQLHGLLNYLFEWKVLESRAILEIVKGRIDIIEKFHTMIIEAAPETAPRKGMDNFHDLIAGYPWLLNPEWQILSEETTISRHLKEWYFEEVKQQEIRDRYDFFALTDEANFLVVEIKSPEHALELSDLQRLERYKENLHRAHENITMVMVYGGPREVSQETLESWEKRPDGDILTWTEIYNKAKKYYEHYRSVLEGNIAHPDSLRKKKEVLQTREVLASGTVYRGRKKRARGLGPQDAEYIKKAEKIKPKEKKDD